MLALDVIRTRARSSGIHVGPSTYLVMISCTCCVAHHALESMWFQGAVIEVAIVFLTLMWSLRRPFAHPVIASPSPQPISHSIRSLLPPFLQITLCLCSLPLSPYSLTSFVLIPLISSTPPTNSFCPHSPFFLIPILSVLLLSYKNHALDEFLIDVIKFSHHGIGRQGNLIRAGKPERIEELQKFSEKYVHSFYFLSCVSLYSLHQCIVCINVLFDFCVDISAVLILLIAKGTELH